MDAYEIKIKPVSWLKTQMQCETFTQNWEKFLTWIGNIILIKMDYAQNLKTHPIKVKKDHTGYHQIFLGGSSDKNEKVFRNFSHFWVKDSPCIWVLSQLTGWIFISYVRTHEILHIFCVRTILSISNFRSKCALFSEKGFSFYTIYKTQLPHFSTVHPIVALFAIFRKKLDLF